MKYFLSKAIFAFTLILSTLTTSQASLNISFSKIYNPNLTTFQKASFKTFCALSTFPFFWIDNTKCYTVTDERGDLYVPKESNINNSIASSVQVKDLQEKYNLIAEKINTNASSTNIILQPQYITKYVNTPGAKGERGERGQDGVSGTNGNNGVNNNINNNLSNNSIAPFNISNSSYQYVPVSGPAGPQGVAGLNGTTTIININGTSTGPITSNGDVNSTGTSVFNILSASNSILVNASSSNFFSNILNAVTAAFSNLFAINATATNLTVSNLNVSNGLTSSANILNSNIGGSVGTTTIINFNSLSFSSTTNVLTNNINGIISTTSIPDANPLTRGLINTTNQSLMGDKTFTGSTLFSNTLTTIDSGANSVSGLKLAQMSFVASTSVVSSVFGEAGNFPQYSVLDSVGNIYIANTSSNNVTKITPSGVSTIFGTTGAQPYGIAIDNLGNIYTANQNSNNVTKITPAGVSTILGTAGSFPYTIITDSANNVYVGSHGTTDVTKITPGGVSSVFGTAGSTPRGMVVDSFDNIYLSNFSSNNVSKITALGVSTILGTTENAPIGITIDAVGNVYTANGMAGSVTKITPAGVSTIFATTGSSPHGITIDSFGNIYTANRSSANVTKITPAGTATTFGTTGPNPRGINIDSSGNIYTINSASNNVTKISFPKSNFKYLTVNSLGDVVFSDTVVEATSMIGGYVSASTQSIGGVKTFTSGITSQGLTNLATTTANNFNVTDLTTLSTTTVTRLTIGTNINQNMLTVLDSDTNNVARFEGIAGAQCTVVAGTGWSCTSDERLKENITDLIGEDILNKIGEIRTVNYNWKNSTDNKIQYGVIAQNIENVFPTLVDTYSNGSKAVRYGEFTSITLAGIRELNKKVVSITDTINSRLINLEGNSISITTLANLLSLASTTNLISGNIFYTTNLDLNNYSLLNVKSITSSNGSWSISEDGTIKAKTLSADYIELLDTDGSKYCYRSVNGNFSKIGLAPCSQYNVIQGIGNNNGGNTSTTTNSNITNSVSSTASTTFIATSSPIITILNNTDTDNIYTVITGVYTEHGATAIDYDGTEVTNLIIIDNSSVNMNATGTYNVTYSVSSATSTLSSSLNRVVKVIE